MHCLENGKPDKKYSENVRQFAMAIMYYSPNTYRYVRSVFNNNLPAPSTIRAWLSSVDGAPGINDQALDALRKKAEEYAERGEEFLINMMCDEMSIKTKMDWDDKKRKFIGYATCQNQCTGQKEEEVPEAKNSLVFMVVGKDFKIPVAYFLLNGLNAYERASLIQLVIKATNETGAKVTSLTQVNFVNSVLTICLVLQN